MGYEELDVFRVVLLAGVITVVACNTSINKYPGISNEQVSQSYGREVDHRGSSIDRQDTGESGKEVEGEVNGQDWGSKMREKILVQVPHNEVNLSPINEETSGEDTGKEVFSGEDQMDEDNRGGSDNLISPRGLEPRSIADWDSYGGDADPEDDPHLPDEPHGYGDYRKPDRGPSRDSRYGSSRRNGFDDDVFSPPSSVENYGGYRRRQHEDIDDRHYYGASNPGYGYGGDRGGGYSGNRGGGCTRDRGGGYGSDYGGRYSNVRGGIYGGDGGGGFGGGGDDIDYGYSGDPGYGPDPGPGPRYGRDDDTIRRVRKIDDNTEEYIYVNPRTNMRRRIVRKYIGPNHTEDTDSSWEPIPGRSPSAFRWSSRGNPAMGPMGGSPNRNNYMLPSRVFDAVQDVIEDQSMFYVTFQCQPKVGKYLCKLQCAKRDERMTGLCESGYCNCILKEEKKMRKQMSKRFRAAMDGYDTDCSDYKKAKHCKRFCKALTPDKAFTGLCKDNHCQCITYPKTPGKKKNACTKAINQLKKIEDKALTRLGIRPRPLSSLGATAEKQVYAAADGAIKKLKSNNSMDGCTEEDIQNLRGIIANLSQGLNLVKGDSILSNLPALAPPPKSP